MDVSTHQRIAQWNGARAPVKVDNTNAVSFTRTLRLKVKREAYGQQAGRSVQVVNERNTTKACSSCGALTGPAGLDKLFVREWSCSECGDTHDRDVNAARNILALRCRASVRGNESLQKLRPPRRASRSRKAGTGEVYATA